MAKRSGAEMIDLEPPMPVVQEIPEPSNDNSDIDIPVTWEGVEKDEEKSGVHEKPLIIDTAVTREELVRQRGEKAAEYEKLHEVLVRGNGVMDEVMESLIEIAKSMDTVGKAYLKVSMQGIKILNHRWIRRMMLPLVIACGLGSANDALNQAADGTLRSGEAMITLTKIYGPKRADELMKQIEQTGHQWMAIKDVTEEIGGVVVDKAEREAEKSPIVRKVTDGYDEAYRKSMKGKK